MSRVLLLLLLALPLLLARSAIAAAHDGVCDGIGGGITLEGRPVPPDSWLCGDHVVHGHYPPLDGYAPVEAPSSTTAVTSRPQPDPVSAPASAGPVGSQRGGAAGCGSRGGPGYRLSSDRCASWDDYNHGRW